MTRSRAGAKAVLSPLVTRYYASRADAGRLVTEGAGPRTMGMGYARTLGIYDELHVAAWRKGTDAVHPRGGGISLPINHVGQIVQSANRTVADAPVTPSAIRPAGHMWTDAKSTQ